MRDLFPPPLNILRAAVEFFGFFAALAVLLGGVYFVGAISAPAPQITEAVSHD